MTNQNSTASELRVGVGATIQLHSDALACTVIAISPSGKSITLQEDEATRVDNNGMSDSQSYTYTPNPNGQLYQATLRKDGRFRLMKQRSLVSIGIRRKFHDYSF